MYGIYEVEREGKVKMLYHYEINYLAKTIISPNIIALSWNQIVLKLSHTRPTKKPYILFLNRLSHLILNTTRN